MFAVQLKSNPKKKKKYRHFLKLLGNVFTSDVFSSSRGLKLHSIQVGHFHCAPLSFQCLHRSIFGSGVEWARALMGIHKQHFLCCQAKNFKLDFVHSIRKQWYPTLIRALNETVQQLKQEHSPIFFSPLNTADDALYCWLVRWGETATHPGAELEMLFLFALWLISTLTGAVSWRSGSSANRLPMWGLSLRTPVHISFTEHRRRFLKRRAEFM